MRRIALNEYDAVATQGARAPMRRIRAGGYRGVTRRTSTMRHRPASGIRSRRPAGGLAVMRDDIPF